MSLHHVAFDHSTMGILQKATLLDMTAIWVSNKAAMLHQLARHLGRHDKPHEVVIQSQKSM